MGDFTWTSDSEGTDPSHDAAAANPHDAVLIASCSQMFMGVRMEAINLCPVGLEDLIPARLRVREGSGDAAVIRGQTGYGSCYFLQKELFPERG